MTVRSFVNKARLYHPCGSAISPGCRRQFSVATSLLPLPFDRGPKAERNPRRGTATRQSACHFQSGSTACDDGTRRSEAGKPLPHRCEGQAHLLGNLQVEPLAVFLEAFKSLDHGTIPPFGQSRKASICGSTKSRRPPSQRRLQTPWSRAVTDEELCLSTYRAERSQTAKYLILWLPDLGSTQGPADQQTGAPKNLVFGRINVAIQAEILQDTRTYRLPLIITQRTTLPGFVDSNPPSRKLKAFIDSMICIHVEDRALKPIPLMPVGFPQSLSSP